MHILSIKGLKAKATNSFIFALTLSCLVVTKRSHILKQTYIFQLQLCLSMCHFFVTTGHLKGQLMSSNTQYMREICNRENI